MGTASKESNGKATERLFNADDIPVCVDIRPIDQPTADLANNCSDLVQLIVGMNPPRRCPDRAASLSTPTKHFCVTIKITRSGLRMIYLSSSLLWLLATNGRRAGIGEIPKLRVREEHSAMAKGKADRWMGYHRQLNRTHTWAPQRKNLWKCRNLAVGRRAKPYQLTGRELRQVVTGLEHIRKGQLV